VEILRGGSRSRGCINRLRVIALLGAVLVSAAPAEIDEYQVKAAFLYNFARFVEWPVTSFSGPHDPIVICILGQNPFGESLSEAIRGKEFGGRPFAVRLLSDLAPKLRCQILFVNSAATKLFRPAAGNLKVNAILTVGETPGFTEDGGVINFKLDSGRIHFEINLEAAEQAHLNISSKLLSLAQIVKTRRAP